MGALVAIHYFHCSDGVDLVLDRAGRDTRDPHDLGRQAWFVAQDLMREVPDYTEWSDWSVYIYDEVGQIVIVPFPEAGRQAA